MNTRYFITKNIAKSILISALGIDSFVAMPSHATDLSQIFGQSKGQVNKADVSAAINGKEQKPKFLPVHEAFGVTAKQSGNQLTVNFSVTPKHYIYKDKLALILPKGVTMGEWQFSQPSVMIDDPDFGRVPVFKTNFSATTNLSADTAINQPIHIRWQGCAEAGLCYPPEKTAVNVHLSANAPQTNTQKTNANKALIDKLSSDEPVSNKNNTPDDNSRTKSALDVTTDKTSDGVIPSVEATSQQINDSDTSGKDVDMPDVDVSDVDVLSANQSTTARYELSHTLQATTNDPFGFSKNPWMAVVLLFLAGLVLAFSACVYPMIPIVANIVARSHNPTPLRGFLLTLSYALGVATSYGLLGVVVAWFGRSLGIIGWLQNPIILIGFAIIFVLLALNMMELIRLRLPSAVRNYLNQVSQKADHKLGSLGGSYLVGVLSALVVSPCVSAPLGGALVAISIIGNVALGFVALFALGMGVTLPLIIMGTTQSHFMPKSGAWMIHIKHFGGLMLFGVAIMLLNRVYLQPFMMVVWAIWFMMSAVFLYRLARLPLQAMGFLMAMWSAVLLTGFAMGKSDPWQPLAHAEATAKNDIRINSLHKLDLILASEPKVLVDVTADWCIECRIMERTLFNQPPSELNSWQVVKLDITQTTDDSRAILARYDLFGPPSLLFYQEGRLVSKQIGEVKRGDFEQILQTLNANNLK